MSDPSRHDRSTSPIRPKGCSAVRIGLAALALATGPLSARAESEPLGLEAAVASARSHAPALLAERGVRMFCGALSPAALSPRR